MKIDDGSRTLISFNDLGIPKKHAISKDLVKPPPLEL
jgi:hypothetical protein